MLHFKRINNITGWVVFGIAALTYILTAEPTASYWDCGEFIAASYKLQVPHPPGAPLFLLINRIFAMLAGGDVTKVAYMINISSALASAFTSLFLFWTLTLLGRRIMKITSDEITLPQTILLMGAGVVGGLAYTFCDSAWFSAVEAEVYAMSSFFTAFVVWAMFKWELIEDPAASNRWLIFIAYIVGLSIGIHLLNLVTLPALGFIFYFKKYKQTTLTGSIICFVAGVIIIFLIMNGIIPGLPSIAGNVEIFFKNTLGLPFGTGITLFVMAVLGSLIFGVYYTQKNQKELYNTILLSLTFILIGYGSYAMVPIRSMYNPPINENNPSDIIEIVKYLKREQYGDRPLFLGPSFATPVIKQEPDKDQPLFRKGKDKYEIYDYKYKTEFDPNQQMLLPRLFSRSDNHEMLYMQKLGLDKNGNGRLDRDENGEIVESEKPRFSDNVRFLFQHQLGHMYLRYFMWNFASRESDIEGASWLKPWEVTTSNMPDEIKNNKGRNQFFWLPLFLGVLGLFFQIQKDSKGFLVTLLIFIMTGIALVIYLNSPPVEPRERDYIYVGSYYAFAIWIGLGVMAIFDLLTSAFSVKTGGIKVDAAGINNTIGGEKAQVSSGVIKNQTLAAIISAGISLAVPTIMVAQGWDDHDRSNRYQQIDSAKNLLNSCAPNAILFTGGDNDTFPLWYVQEVEGFRTDVRVCNLSLLGTDWYVEQMKRKTYQSEPLPITFPFERFIQGTNDVVYFVEDKTVKSMDLSVYLKAVRDNVNDPRVKIASGDEVFTKLPTTNLVVKIDSAKLANSNVIPEQYKPYIRSYMAWALPKANIYKPELMQLEMISNIAAANWNRPIYFSTSMGFPGRNSSFLALQDYLVLEGMAYRLLPVRLPKSPGTGTAIDTDVMFDNMTKKMFWREMNNPKVYYDDNYREKGWVPARMYFYFLAQSLLSEGKKEKAVETIKYSLKVMPDDVLPLDYISARYIPLLYECGETALADSLKNKVITRAEKALAYYGSSDAKGAIQENASTNLQIISIFADFYQDKGDSVQAKKYNEILMKNYQKIRSLGGAE
jgi:hypothetical protein